MAKKGKRRLTYFEAHKNKNPPYVTYCPFWRRLNMKFKRLHEQQERTILALNDLGAALRSMIKAVQENEALRNN